MMWLKVVFLGVAFFAGNINAAKRARILSGYTASIQDYPYQASIRYNNQHTCGGSIISQRHILTAAHCIDSTKVFAYSVVTGTSYRTYQAIGQGNFYQIAKVVVHPYFVNYGNRAVHDIAVITLQNLIVFNVYQNKINLPQYNFRIGTRAIVTGWGLVQQFPDALPNQLQMIVTELTSREECQKWVSDPVRTPIYDTEVCSIRTSASGICLGDSGGPLAANGELIGIVSWFDGHVCAQSVPNIFTNVFAYKDFIISAMS